MCYRRGAIELEKNAISEATRRAIVDELCAGDAFWPGRLREDEFLARMFDLTSMPSRDYRFRNAGGDIRQHRNDWHDWDDDWVFYDERFNILRSPDDVFLQFLVETVHPVVRPNTDVALRLVSMYNQHLAADGWQLVEVSRISGRPVFAASKAGARSVVFEEPTGWQKVDRQLQEIRARLDAAKTEEDFQTIGLLCREVLISAAQAVFDPARHPTLDGVRASDTDAKRMLEAIIEVELRGGANEEARTQARAAVRLAVALQHDRSADFRSAALTAEAASSVVNLLAVLSGRRRGSI